MIRERPRILEDRLRKALEFSPVTLLHGPRQVGKTTLARRSLARGHEDLSLDDGALLEAARQDPIGFVERAGPRVFIDEVQRAPELFRAIKLVVDRDRRPGRFLLTGSANALLLPALGDSLAGRLKVLTMMPLAQAELESSRCDFLERLFEGTFPLTRTARLGRNLIERVVRGGFPLAALASSAARAAGWLRDFAQLLLHRDLREVSRVRDVRVVERLLTHVAVDTAHLWKSASYAGPLELDRTTVKRHIEHLQALFLVQALPAWFDNETKRLVKSPKLHMVDSGLCCALRGIDVDRLDSERTKLGPLLETFAVQEILRLCGGADDPPRLHHYRDRNGAEIDLVLEKPDGRVAAVEIKAGATVRSNDFRVLERFREALGERFRCGVVLYDGEATAPFGDRLFAAPFSWLWRSG